MKRVIAISIISVLTAVTICAFLFLNGNIKINNLLKSQFPVRGVDVSSYQGKINWNVLAKQDIQFAFIKATEGSHLTDKNFRYNYEHAIKTNLYVGAYHFFSFDSSGTTQAKNFIATVPKNNKMLPPVVDVEFYGDKERKPPNTAMVRKNLTALLKKLEAYYGKKPIIYATQKSYNLYIAGGYSQYDLWISNVLFPPALSDTRNCTFWQYSDKGKLKGYKGTEKHIDLNVFCGSQRNFTRYTKY